MKWLIAAVWLLSLSLFADSPVYVPGGGGPPVVVNIPGPHVWVAAGTNTMVTASSTATGIVYTVSSTGSGSSSGAIASLNGSGTNTALNYGPTQIGAVQVASAVEQDDSLAYNVAYFVSGATGTNALCNGLYMQSADPAGLYLMLATNTANGLTLVCDSLFFNFNEAWGIWISSVTNGSIDGVTTNKAFFYDYMVASGLGTPCNLSGNQSGPVYPCPDVLTNDHGGGALIAVATNWVVTGMQITGPVQVASSLSLTNLNLPAPTGTNGFYFTNMGGSLPGSTSDFGMLGRYTSQSTFWLAFGTNAQNYGGMAFYPTHQTYSGKQLGEINLEASGNISFNSLWIQHGVYGGFGGSMYEYYNNDYYSDPASTNYYNSIPLQFFANVWTNAGHVVTAGSLDPNANSAPAIYFRGTSTNGSGAWVFYASSTMAPGASTSWTFNKEAFRITVGPNASVMASVPVIFSNAPAAPTPEVIGSNNGAMWVSNTHLYYSYTSDGSSSNASFLIK